MRKATKSSRGFYPHLAASNLVSNAKSYLPYIITSILTIAMYYIMHFLSINNGLDLESSGGYTLSMVLSFGTWVMAIFSAIFLFYTNSFIIKRRKKEFGLFNILGMEKKHIAITMLFETLYTSIISIILGLLFGILFSKLGHLLLMKIMNFDIMFGFEISKAAIKSAVTLFGAIFIATFLSSLFQIQLSSPIELIKGGQVGEREPKVRWILVLAGVVCLGGGYYISIATTHPLQALVLFFVAVVLVIIGTYCLFTAGSIAILKILKRNRSYYYKPNHFISVSSMMYRMKQNAAGLASICVLSTMVLITVSTTVSLYIGSEDALLDRYPNEILIRDVHYNEASHVALDSAVTTALDKAGLEADYLVDYRYLATVLSESGDQFSISYDDSDVYGFVNVRFLPQEDLAKTVDTPILPLESGEIAVYSDGSAYGFDTFTFYGKQYSVKQSESGFDGFSVSGAYNGDVTKSYYIALSSFDELKAVRELCQENVQEGEVVELYRNLSLDVEAEDQVIISLCSDILALGGEDLTAYGETRAANRSEFYAMYGGLFFLGIFLGAMFIMATVIIIYYKQISEGYDDKSRYTIMKNVGLSKRMVKKSINSQILTMFFLPLAAACIHTAVAFPALTRILSILNLKNVSLFVICTIGTAAVFAVLYIIVYMATAKEYYRIVDAR